MYGSEVNLSDPVRMTEEQKTIVQDFNCGNEVINSYLKEKACDDPFVLAATNMLSFFFMYFNIALFNGDMRSV